MVGKGGKIKFSLSSYTLWQFLISRSESDKLIKQPFFISPSFASVKAFCRRSLLKQYAKARNDDDCVLNFKGASVK
jgi:hypothetical protein